MLAFIYNYEVIEILSIQSYQAQLFYKQINDIFR